MHADVDRQSRTPSFVLEAEDEGTDARWLDEGERFGGGEGDVVCCFGEEEGLDWLVLEERGKRGS